MDLGNVMQAVADRLGTIAGLRVYAYPPDVVQPPAAIVTYPGTLTFDETYGRGMDRIEDLGVVLLVGKVSDRASRDLITKWVKGSGAFSVKAVLESGTYTAFDTIRVVKAEFDIITVAGVEHLAATLTLDIAGTGA
jgi:hypothetical protein